MTNQQLFIDAVYWAFGLIYDAWPVLFANIIVARDRLWRNLLITWILFDVFFIATQFDPYPRSDLLIPEPLNTGAFFVTGVILMLLFAVSILRDRPHRSLALKDVRKASQLTQISHSDFTSMVIHLLNSAGHQAERAQNDNPLIDIRMRTGRGETCLVRCIMDENPVQLNTIIKTAGLLSRERHTQVMITTPHTFSVEALEWAKSNPTLLYDGPRLWELWTQSVVPSG